MNEPSPLIYIQFQYNDQTGDWTSEKWRLPPGARDLSVRLSVHTGYGAHSLLFSGYRGLFPGVEADWASSCELNRSKFRYFADRASQYIYLNALDALNFIMSLFHASTCFEHKCSSSGGQNCTIQSLVSSH